MHSEEHAIMRDMLLAKVKRNRNRNRETGLLDEIINIKAPRSNSRIRFPVNSQDVSSDQIKQIVLGNFTKDLIQAKKDSPIPTQPTTAQKPQQLSEMRSVSPALPKDDPPMRKVEKLIYAKSKQIEEDEKKSHFNNYLFFLEAVKHIHHLELPPDEGQVNRFNCYVGRGNNEGVVVSALRKRWWWNISSNANSPFTDEERGVPSNLNLVWTQTKVMDYCAEIEESKPCGFKMVPTSLSMEEIMSGLDNFAEGEELGLLKKMLDSRKGVEFMETYGKLSNCEDLLKVFKAYCSFFRLNNSTNNSGGVLIGKGLLGSSPHFAEVLSQVNSSRDGQTEFVALEPDGNKPPKGAKEDAGNHKEGASLKYKKIHNHLLDNKELGDKMNLFFNLRNYFATEKLSMNLYSLIPLTFVVKNTSDTTIFEVKNLLEQIDSARKQGNLSSPGHLFSSQLHTIKADQNMWILKPGENSNRGRGIQVGRDMKTIMEFIREADGPVIIQKYIENPLLYKNRKFDFRMYCLISWTNGKARLYFYKMGYVRTSSFNYSLDSSDTFIHLTNEAVQIKAAEFSKFEKGNKVSLSDIADYIKSLRPDLDFFKTFLPKMKEYAKICFLSVAEKILPKQKEYAFELFGLDFMIDDQFTLWLIEVNTNPCLSITSPVTGAIIPNLVDDVLK